MSEQEQLGEARPPRPSIKFFRALLSRPVLLLTLFVTILVVGVIAFWRVPVQMMPDGLTEPGLEVFVTNPGSSAQENEEQVARVLEEEFRTLPRLENVYSSSRSESVGIEIQFKSDTDMNFAKAEVRDRIERARPKLPKGVRDIGIWSWSQSNLPVMFFALLHPGDSSRTDFLVDAVIKRRLEAVDGVGRLEIWGTLDDSLRILLDEDKVREAHLDIGKLLRRLRADNFAQPLGEVEDGGRRILLRADMRFKTPEEIKAYPVGGGLVVGDLATVENVKSIRERLFRIDGRYAYYGEVAKDGQANAVETCKRLQKTLKELEKDPALKGEFEFIVLFNQGEFIENSLGALTNTAREGGIFAILILFLFLWRVRLTLLVALSIPLSALVTVAWIFFTGGSFNVLTMTGITLAMGMLVDNSIVVIENITRLRQLGRSPFDACVEGTAEVGLPVLLSTLTTVVVFMPLIFMSENPSLRIMFGELGIPLCISLIASLAAALVFLPVQVRGALGERSPRVQRFVQRFAYIGALPARAIAWTVAGPRALGRGALRATAAVQRVLLVEPPAFVFWTIVTLIAAGALALSGSIVAQQLMALNQVSRASPFELGPGLQSGIVMRTAGIALAGLAVAALALFGLPFCRRRAGRFVPATSGVVPSGNSVIGFIISANHALVEWTLRHRLLATGCALLALLSIILPANNMKVAAFGRENDRSRVNFWVELEENFTFPQAEQEMIHYEDFLQTKKAEYGFDRIANRFQQNGGRMSLFWKKPQSEEHMRFVQRDLQEKLPHLAGHKLQFIDDQGADNESTSVVTFRLRGADSEVLARLGGQAVTILETISGLTDLRSPLSDAPPVVHVKMESDVAQRLGVSADAALQNISWALRGVQLPSYQEPGREVPFIIEYDRAQEAGLGTLRDLNVYNGETSVPLSSFANLSFDRMSRTIDRKNGEASFTIQAHVDNPSMQKIVAQRGRLALQALDLPRGYAIADEDMSDKKQEQEMNDIFAALALSVVLVFLLMGVLFESFLLPVSVLFTIPYAVVGAYWTLFLTGTAMDSVGWIGVIILVGVVVNNGIVLIACIHDLRAAGMDRARAVVEGCGQRVRPILMTALTSVMGLLPMALTEPAGQGIDYRALATCVAGGLALSTVFTLWVVPLAYTLIEDASKAASARFLWSLRPWRRSHAQIESSKPEVAAH